MFLFKGTYYVVPEVCSLQGKLEDIWPPTMLLRIYSLCVLVLDLVMLFVAIAGTVLISIYRMFKPPSLKSLHNEIAMVIRDPTHVINIHADVCFLFSTSPHPSQFLGNRRGTWSR